MGHSVDKVSMPYLFPSQDITKCVIKFLFRQSMTSKLEDPSSIILESNGRQGKERGRRKYKNMNISITKRAF